MYARGARQDSALDSLCEQAECFVSHFTSFALSVTTLGLHCEFRSRGLA